MFEATVNVRLDFSHLLEIAPQLLAMVRGNVQIITPSAPAVPPAVVETPAIAPPATSPAAVPSPAEQAVPPADLTRRGRGRPKPPTSDIPTVAENPAPKHEAAPAQPVQAIPGFDEVLNTDLGTKPDPTPATPDEVTAVKDRIVAMIRVKGVDGWEAVRKAATETCVKHGAKFDKDQLGRIVLTTMSRGAMHLLNRELDEATK